MFDCFCALYEFFPKFLGEEVSVNIVDFFIDGNIDTCKRNIIEKKVKTFIQANNIKDIINGFKKQFDVKKMTFIDNELNLLYEIALVRNLVIHNNSIVNRAYKESVKIHLKNKEKYFFNENATVLPKLEYLVQDIKYLSEKIAQNIADILIEDAQRLNKYHENK